MARKINSSCLGLSAGAIGLCVTVWLFTTDVCMLRLRKIYRPDLKHFSIYSSSPMWKYSSHSKLFLDPEPF